ncbi:hypothetical protein O9K51_09967 [Purpureocillium lavendulum]|uniref:Uncharacterized protein n=1 Tax=Purpureocillium lavendulum TaxID=1247861 RepID=A0AB34FG79_9HYPO|nr:hypothetical protein O9K51_09967 [Purpureocillium lavendulum]
MKTGRKARSRGYNDPLTAVSNEVGLAVAMEKQARKVFAGTPLNTASEISGSSQGLFLTRLAAERGGKKLQSRVFPNIALMDA